MVWRGICTEFTLNCCYMVYSFTCLAKQHQDLAYTSKCLHILELGAEIWVIDSVMPDLTCMNTLQEYCTDCLIRICPWSIISFIHSHQKPLFILENEQRPLTNSHARSVLQSPFSPQKDCLIELTKISCCNLTYVYIVNFTNQTQFVNLQNPVLGLSQACSSE